MLRKIRQEPPGSWTSGEGGVAPFDPPALCPSGIGCGSIEPAASSGASLPSHGLKIEGVTPVELEEKNKTDLPTNLKWQIGLFLWHKPYRGGAGTAGGAKRPPRGIPKGAALGAPLVTFPATGKSPGCRAERLQVGAGAARPTKTPGARGGAPAWWVQGLPALHKLPGYGAERPPYGGVGAQPLHFGE